MACYGYLRNDYPVPLSQQIEQILSIKCDKVYVESLDISDHSQLELLRLKLVEKDTVAVPDLRVLTLPLNYLSELLMEFGSKNIRIISVGDKMDSEKPLLLCEAFAIYSSLEKMQMEITEIQRKTNEKEIGRPRISPKVINEIQFLYNNQGLTMREIADKTNVSLGTVFKYSNLYEEKL